MDTVRVGIVGVGNIFKLHALAYQKAMNCELVAVCDSVPERANVAAHVLGLRPYTSLDHMLLTDDIDMVEVLTPTTHHYEHVVSAINAGKHVSCQKPMAETARDCLGMIEVIENSDRLFQVFENYLYYPPLMRAKAIIQNGGIGKPLTLNIKTVTGKTVNSFMRHTDGKPNAWREDETRRGLGHLFDDGVHKYAVAMWLFDQPVRKVNAMLMRRGYDDHGVITWEYGNGDAFGTMEVTPTQMMIPSDYYGCDEYFEVQGDEGLIWIPSCAGRLRSHLPPISVWTNGSWHTPHVNSDWGSSFNNAAQAFVDCIRLGRKPLMDAVMAKKVLDFCLAAYTSAHYSTPVVL